MMTTFKIEFDGKFYDAVLISWYSSYDNTGACALAFAPDTLCDALYADRATDTFVSEKAERIFNSIEYFTHNAHTAATEVDFINELCQENPDYKEIFNRHEVRRCDVCGKVMDTGHMDNWSDWHVCSDECRDKYYEDHGGVERMHEDMENDQCFYTEWESVFYND